MNQLSELFDRMQRAAQAAQLRYFMLNVVVTALMIGGAFTFMFVKSERDVLLLLNEIWTVKSDVRAIKGPFTTGVQSVAPSGRFPLKIEPLTETAGNFPQK